VSGDGDETAGHEESQELAVTGIPGTEAVPDHRGFYFLGHRCAKRALAAQIACEFRVCTLQEGRVAQEEVELRELGSARDVRTGIAAALGNQEE
jgi:hypothetical protein